MCYRSILNATKNTKNSRMSPRIRVVTRTTKRIKSRETPFQIAKGIRTHAHTPTDATSSSWQGRAHNRIGTRTGSCNGRRGQQGSALCRFMSFSSEEDRTHIRELNEYFLFLLEEQKRKYSFSSLMCAYTLFIHSTIGRGRGRSR